MSRKRVAPEIISIAKQLGIGARADPTDKIVEHCTQKVSEWVEELGPVTSLPELLELVQAKLRLRFETVSENRDIELIRNKYLAAGEFGFVDLNREFELETDAVVLRLENAPAWSDCRYVAVVDGRGWRAARVWFSKWHEIAHLLAEPQTKFVFRRTESTKREAVERLMDRIGGQLAFYPPLFLPALRASGINLEAPKLSDLRRFHKNNASFASLHATLNAVIQHVSSPMVLIEAQVRGKRSEPGDERLRAVSTSHNPVALQRRIFIHRNMRVPDQSIIAAVFSGDSEVELRESAERLSWWESEGRSLFDAPVLVEAMRAGAERVIAVVRIVS